MDLETGVAEICMELVTVGQTQFLLVPTVFVKFCKTVQFNIASQIFGRFPRLGPGAN